MRSPTTIRAAVYLRQSLDRNGDLLAVSRQREDLAQLCQRRGWTAREYIDNDFSASVRMPGSARGSKRRPAYERMLKDIKGNNIDAIAAWDCDRLYRHPRELEDLIDLADDRGLELATIGGDYDLSTPSGRGNARMKAVFARMEMEQKSVRQKRANLQRATAEDGGRPTWPSRPFGYDADLDPTTGRWWTVRRDPATKEVIAVNRIRKHPVEAKLLREAYRRFNAGATLYTIAKGWNDKGVKTPKGNTWSGATVRAVLIVARNAGLREYNGEVVGKGTWPPIVSEDVWRMAKRKLEDPKRATTAPRGRKYLLSGIARCGLCDARLGSGVTETGLRQYVCRGCQKIVRDGAKVDELIIEAVVRRLSADDAVELLRPPVEEVDADALREERRALEDGLAQLGRDFANAPAAFRASALADIQAKLDAIDAVLTDPGKAAIYEDVIGAKDVRKAFLGLDLGRQRTIVDALVTIKINRSGNTGRVFNPDAIDLEWK